MQLRWLNKIDGSRVLQIGHQVIQQADARWIEWFDVDEVQNRIYRQMKGQQRRNLRLMDDKGTLEFGRSRRGCRNTPMIEATRRAVSRRWRILRRGGVLHIWFEMKEAAN